VYKGPNAVIFGIDHLMKGRLKYAKVKPLGSHFSPSLNYLKNTINFTLIVHIIGIYKFVLFWANDHISDIFIRWAT